MTAVLEVEGLRVDIAMAAGTLHAVRGVDLALAPGETLGLVGETGCGKSLSALALMDLLPRRARRSARRMVLDGEDLAAASPRRMEDLRGDRMAMIFQEPMTSLNPAYTIGNQLAEALTRHRAVGAAAARDRAVELLEKVGITAADERLRQYPHQLSGGLRQRVMIAMALMCGPRLLICDEPTTALDVTIQAQILLLLKALQREFGMAMIFITHDLGVVARIADRIAVMYAGEVVELASAAELFAAPGHPYTRGLLRCLPVPGRDRGEPLGVIPGMVPNLAQEIAGCAFANRCDRAADACRAAPPPWAPGAHRARCILAPRAVA